MVANFTTYYNIVQSSKSGVGNIVRFLKKIYKYIYIYLYILILIYIYIYISGDSSLFLLLVPPPPPSVNFSSQPVVRGPKVSHHSCYCIAQIDKRTLHGVFFVNNQDTI